MPVRLLIVGTLFVLGGSLLLLWTSADIPHAQLLWPLFLILPGLGFLYKAVVRHGSEKHTIPGTFLTLLGIYFLLCNTVLPDNEIEKIWPIFMLITGLSMIPYGIKKNRNTKNQNNCTGRCNYNNVAFFLPFTLKLLTVKFINFATRWWPALLIILDLFSYYLLHKNAYNEEK